MNQPQTVRVRFLLRKRTLYARLSVDGVSGSCSFSLQIGVTPPRHKHFPADDQWDYRH